MIMLTNDIYSNMYLIFMCPYVINVFVCLYSGLAISKENVHACIANKPRISHIGRYRLSFAHDTTLGMLRRMLQRVAVGTDGTLSVGHRYLYVRCYIYDDDVNDYNNDDTLLDIYRKISMSR